MAGAARARGGGAQARSERVLGPNRALGQGRQTTLLTLAAVDLGALGALLARYGLKLEQVPEAAPIPGSYWGEPEAGVIGDTVYARADTPLHSLLHEACHLVVAAPERRAAIDTDASDSVDEENAACYLQILLAAEVAGANSEQLMADMDAWGYSFRLGSAKAWFERDAEDARAWLAQRGLLPAAVVPTPALAGSTQAP